MPLGPMRTKAQKQAGMHEVMGEFKRGQLRSGSKTGPRVTSRKQAIAIGLSQTGQARGYAEGGIVEHDFDPDLPRVQDDARLEPQKMEYPPEYLQTIGLLARNQRKLQGPSRLDDGGTITDPNFFLRRDRERPIAPTPKRPIASIRTPRQGRRLRRVQDGDIEELYDPSSLRQRGRGGVRFLQDGGDGGAGAGAGAGAGEGAGGCSGCGQGGGCGCQGDACGSGACGACSCGTGGCGPGGCQGPGAAAGTGVGTGGGTGGSDSGIGAGVGAGVGAGIGAGLGGFAGAAAEAAAAEGVTGETGGKGGTTGVGWGGLGLGAIGAPAAAPAAVGAPAAIGGPASHAGVGAFGPGGCSMGMTAGAAFAGGYYGTGGPGIASGALGAEFGGSFGANAGLGYGGTGAPGTGAFGAEADAGGGATSGIGNAGASFGQGFGGTSGYASSGTTDLAAAADVGGGHGGDVSQDDQGGGHGGGQTTGGTTQGGPGGIGFGGGPAFGGVQADLSSLSAAYGPVGGAMAGPSAMSGWASGGKGGPGSGGWGTGTTGVGNQGAAAVGALGGGFSGVSDTATSTADAGTGAGTGGTDTSTSTASADEAAPAAADTAVATADEPTATTDETDEGKGGGKGGGRGASLGTQVASAAPSTVTDATVDDTPTAGPTAPASVTATPAGPNAFSTTGLDAMNAAAQSMPGGMAAVGNIGVGGLGNAPGGGGWGTGVGGVGNQGASIGLGAAPGTFGAAGPAAADVPAAAPADEPATPDPGRDARAALDFGLGPQGLAPAANAIANTVGGWLGGLGYAGVAHGAPAITSEPLAAPAPATPSWTSDFGDPGYGFGISGVNTGVAPGVAGIGLGVAPGTTVGGLTDEGTLSGEPTGYAGNYGNTGKGGGPGVFGGGWTGIGATQGGQMGAVAAPGLAGPSGMQGGMNPGQVGAIGGATHGVGGGPTGTGGWSAGIGEMGVAGPGLGIAEGEAPQGGISPAIAQGIDLAPEVSQPAPPAGPFGNPAETFGPSPAPSKGGAQNISAPAPSFDPDQDLAPDLAAPPADFDPTMTAPAVPALPGLQGPGPTPGIEIDPGTLNQTGSLEEENAKGAQLAAFAHTLDPYVGTQHTAPYGPAIDPSVPVSPPPELAPPAVAPPPAPPSPFDINPAPSFHAPTPNQANLGSMLAGLGFIGTAQAEAAPYGGFPGALGDPTSAHAMTGPAPSMSHEDFAGTFAQAAPQEAAPTPSWAQDLSTQTQGLTGRGDFSPGPDFAGTFAQDFGPSAPGTTTQDANATVAGGFEAQAAQAASQAQAAQAAAAAAFDAEPATDTLTAADRGITAPAPTVSGLSQTVSGLSQEALDAQALGEQGRAGGLAGPTLSESQQGRGDRGAATPAPGLTNQEIAATVDPMAAQQGRDTLAAAMTAQQAQDARDQQAAQALDQQSLAEQGRGTATKGDFLGTLGEQSQGRGDKGATTPAPGLTNQEIAATVDPLSAQYGYQTLAAQMTAQQALNESQQGRGDRGATTPAPGLTNQEISATVDPMAVQQGYQTLAAQMTAQQAQTALESQQGRGDKGATTPATAQPSADIQGMSPTTTQDVVDAMTQAQTQQAIADPLTQALDEQARGEQARSGQPAPTAPALAPVGDLNPAMTQALSTGPNPGNVLAGTNVNTDVFGPTALGPNQSFTQGPLTEAPGIHGVPTPGPQTPTPTATPSPGRSAPGAAPGAAPAPGTAPTGGLVGPGPSVGGLGGGRSGAAQDEMGGEIENVVRRDPASAAQVATMTPGLVAGLTQMFGDADVGRMFSDVGFNRKEQNPAPPEDANKGRLTLEQPQPTFGMGMSEGGYVTEPGYYAVGGLGPSSMRGYASQAHFSGANVKPAINPPGVHLINSSVPGRTDRIPMKAPPGSFVLPADVVSGLGQGNTMAGAKMWGQAIAAKIGPMGIANTMRMRAARAPTASLRMGSGSSRGFAAGGEIDDDELVPIVVAGGEAMVDPIIVEAMGYGDPLRGKRELMHSVMTVRNHVIKHLKSLPRPIS